MRLPYHNEDYKVNREVFEQVVKDVESGVVPLHFGMIGAIFGQPFWELIALMQPEITIKIVKSSDKEIMLEMGRIPNSQKSD